MPPIDDGQGASPASGEEQNPAVVQDDNPPDNSVVQGNELDANENGKADTSTAADDAKKESEAPNLLSVLQDAVDKTPASEKSSPSEEKSEASSEDDLDENESKKDEEQEDPPFHQHPRWKSLLSERDTLKEQVASYQSGHEQFQKIEQYMDVSNLTGEEVAQGFDVMSMIKNDPKEAVVFLEGYINQIKGHLGYTLPDDIQQKVETGQIDEETALELSRTRRDAEIAGQKVSAQSERVRQQQEQEQEARVQQDNYDAVSEWERKTSGADPDYSKKAPLISDAIQAIFLKEGMPQNSEQAVNVAKRAYDHVSNAMRPARPQKRPTPSETGGNSNTASAKPQTMAEAISGAL